jgi:CheY-like chemotaxis protein/HPt (histidine-containing phosphotransfer) domain-containing protein
MAAVASPQHRERFLTTAKERISRSLALLNRPEGRANLIGELHTLGGEASMVGLPELAQTAWDGEKAARALGPKGDEAQVQCARSLRKLSYLVQGLTSKAVTPVPPTASVGKECRVLIVDDSPVAAQALADVFETRGYQVRSATSMQQVLEICATFSPSVLVTDVYMPNLDVAELCRRFRKETRAQRSAVLLISGRSQAELRDLLEAIRPDAFVPKLAGADVVVSRVATVFQGLGA